MSSFYGVVNGMLRFAMLPTRIQSPKGGLSALDANNRIVAGSGVTYDANGNTTNDGTTAYTFDAENRLTSATNTSRGLTCYIYNAEGQRVRKTYSTVGTCAAPTSSTPNDYLYDLTGHLINIIGIRNEVFAGNRHLASYTFSSTYFMHADWLGTERARSNSSGASYATCTSLPFGDWLTCAGGSDPSPDHFTGKQHDYESGLDDFEARFDSSSMGRFMSPDPANIGVNRHSPQSWNAYSYSLNNPLNLTDPTGLYVCEDSTKCDSQNDKNFAQSLADAQNGANALKDQYGANSDEYQNAQSAIDAYGAQGVDNGVNVRFDSNVTGGVTDVSGVANGNKSADNPTGQNINVTFNPNAVGGDFDGGLVAHEGSHVAEGSAWVASGFSPNLNPTNFATEFKAYHVQFDVGNALLNMKAGPGGSYTGYFNVPPNGRVDWKKGDTFKAITPDLQQKIKENYQNLNSPAFTKGAVLQP